MNKKIQGIVPANLPGDYTAFLSSSIATLRLPETKNGQLETFEEIEKLTVRYFVVLFQNRFKNIQNRLEYLNDYEQVFDHVFDTAKSILGELENTPLMQLFEMIFQNPEERKTIMWQIFCNSAFDKLGSPRYNFDVENLSIEQVFQILQTEIINADSGSTIAAVILFLMFFRTQFEMEVKLYDVGHLTPEIGEFLENSKCVLVDYTGLLCTYMTVGVKAFVYNNFINSNIDMYKQLFPNFKPTFNRFTIKDTFSKNRFWTERAKNSYHQFLKKLSTSYNITNFNFIDLNDPSDPIFRQTLLNLLLCCKDSIIGSYVPLYDIELCNIPKLEDKLEVFFASKSKANRDQISSTVENIMKIVNINGIVDGDKFQTILLKLYKSFIKGINNVK